MALIVNFYLGYSLLLSFMQRKKDTETWADNHAKENFFFPKWSLVERQEMQPQHISFLCMAARVALGFNPWSFLKSYHRGCPSPSTLHELPHRNKWGHLHGIRFGRSADLAKAGVLPARHVGNVTPENLGGRFLCAAACAVWAGAWAGRSGTWTGACACAISYCGRQGVCRACVELASRPSWRCVSTRTAPAADSARLVCQDTQVFREVQAPVSPCPPASARECGRWPVCVMELALPSRVFQSWLPPRELSSWPFHDQG